MLKDFLALRPIFHFTESRVRGHIALCVLASMIEAVMGKDLAQAGVADPELDDQAMTPRRALRTLARIRAVRLVADNGVARHVVTKPSALQARILAALRVDTSTWQSRLSA